MNATNGFILPRRARRFKRFFGNGARATKKNAGFGTSSFGRERESVRAARFSAEPPLAAVEQEAKKRFNAFINIYIDKNGEKSTRRFRRSVPKRFLQAVERRDSGPFRRRFPPFSLPNKTKINRFLIKETKMSEKTLRVGILMGSDSDWDKINGVAKALDEFNVGYEIHVMSAHRTPDKVLEYASTAKSRGLRVIVAAAGGAAHLAGVVASHTPLPVIGIPVKTDMMGGLDSLLATVQMPGDVPVATVGTGSGGARNAGLLAVQILALSDETLAAAYDDFKRKLVDKIAAKDAAFQAKLSS